MSDYYEAEAAYKWRCETIGNRTNNQLNLIYDIATAEFTQDGKSIEGDKAGGLSEAFLERLDTLSRMQYHLLQKQYAALAEEIPGLNKADPTPAPVTPAVAPAPKEASLMGAIEKGLMSLAKAFGITMSR